MFSGPIVWHKSHQLIEACHMTILNADSFILDSNYVF